MYDADAQKLAIKVIGTVESNLNYAAVNFNDPITVGVAQWYGTRAAALLQRMMNEQPYNWYEVAQSLNVQLKFVPSSDTWWNSRYLTRAEGDSLAGVLTRNQAIQNTQLAEDLEAYKATAISYGFDPDANTATVIYFFSMHHQAPASALEVISTLDTAATLDDIHAATLAHPVLGQYGSRYRTTYDLIQAADFGGVDPEPPVEPPVVVPNSNARVIQSAGDLLMVNFENGEMVTFYPSGRGQWTPRESEADPPPPTPEQPEPPVGSGTWFHPAPGTTITSPYGPRSFDGFHWGADLAAATPPDIPIIAVTDIVWTVAFENGFGNATAGTYAKGHSPDGAHTWSFAHMKAGSLAVTAGTTSPAGTQIGVMGGTGNVTGPHLHLEAYVGVINDPWAPPYGNPIDPLPILRSHGVQI